MRKNLTFLVCIAISLLINFLLYNSFLNDFINDYYKNILIIIGINVILGTSLNLITGFTGQFSLGHAGFMAVGGYVSIAISTYFAPFFRNTFGETFIGNSITLVIVLLIGGICAALAGLVVGIPSLRLRGDYLAIITLGFSEIIRIIIQGLDVVGGSQGFSVVYIYENGTKSLQSVDALANMPFNVYQVPKLTNFFWTFFFAILTVFLIYNLINSVYGKGFIAVKDDEVAAKAMGINTTKYKIIAFVTGAFFAGIAGGLLGHHTQTLIPEDFNFLRSVEIVIMVILGGMGSIWGVIIAAVVLSILPELLRNPEISIVFIFAIPYLYALLKVYTKLFKNKNYIKSAYIAILSTAAYAAVLVFLMPQMISNIPNISTLRMIIYALILIIIMLNRPQGLFVKKINTVRV